MHKLERKYTTIHFNKLKIQRPDGIFKQKLMYCTLQLTPIIHDAEKLGLIDCMIVLEIKQAFKFVAE